MRCTKCQGFMEHRDLYLYAPETPTYISQYYCINCGRVTYPKEENMIPHLGEIYLKENVKILKLNVHTLKLLTAVIKVWNYHAPGIVPVITGGSETIPLSKRPRTSLHYKHLALDFRKRNLTEATVQVILKEMKFSLGKDFDVVNESSHIHIEYDPKKGE